MLNPCANTRLPVAALLLVMAGCLVLPLTLAGQTLTPAFRAARSEHAAPGRSAGPVGQAHRRAESGAGSERREGRGKHPQPDRPPALSNVRLSEGIGRFQPRIGTGPLREGCRRGGGGAQRIGELLPRSRAKPKVVGDRAAGAGCGHGRRRQKGPGRGAHRPWVGKLQLDKNQEALEFLNRALPLAQHGGRFRPGGRCFAPHRRCHLDLRQPQKALEFYDQALRNLSPHWRPRRRRCNAQQHRSLVLPGWPEAKGVGPLHPGLALRTIGRRPRYRGHHFGQHQLHRLSILGKSRRRWISMASCLPCGERWRPQ